MPRLVVRSTAALAAAVVAFAGAACTSAESPDPTTETTEPIEVAPNEEVSEGFPPDAPADEGGATEG